jgi:hypothetical protein
MTMVGNMVDLVRKWGTTLLCERRAESRDLESGECRAKKIASLTDQKKTS